MADAGFLNACLGMNSFFSAAQDYNLAVVIVGGLVGGALQPIAAKLVPSANNPSSNAYWQSPLLGLAAAGISIYVVAHTQTDEMIPLMFVAVLCGLAFPAVLSQAFSTMGQRTADLQRDLGKIADASKSDGIQANVQVAEKLRTTLAQNPLASVKPENQEAIEKTAQLAIANIAATPTIDAADQQKIVGELQDVGAVAKAAGWDQAAQAAAEQLKKLSDTVDDDAAKAVATQAADRLSAA